MGRKKASDSEGGAMDEAETNGTEGGKKSVRQYWMDVLTAHPAWLTIRSNARLFEQYLKDHPGEAEVPLKAKQGLSTVKTLMRKGRGKRKRGRKAAAAAGDSSASTVATAPRKGARSTQALEQLEERIDDVLALARTLGHEGLERVISSLKTARNAVIVLLARE